MSAHMMELSANGWDMAVDLRFGGGVASLRHDGRDVLDPAPQGATSPVQLGTFALAPYANRIAHGRFAFGEQQVETARLHPGEPHGLHGLLWYAQVEPIAQGPEHLTLAFTHEGPDWPWAFRVEQTYRLSQAGWVHELAIINLASTDMPHGLGFHPRFKLARDSRVDTQLSHIWLTDETLLPTWSAMSDPRLDAILGAPFADWPFIDHCCGGWQGRALIDVAGLDRQVHLSASAECGFLHVYAPGNGTACFEPVTHMPDQANRGGMALLAPGARHQIVMGLGLGQDPILPT